MMIIEDIKANIRNAPSLDFGDIFNESIELFKKSVVHGFVMQILILLFTSPFIVLLYVPLVMGAIAESQSSGVYSIEEDSGLIIFSSGVFVLFIIAMIIIGALTLAMRAGFIRMLHFLDQGLEVKTKDLFYFFKSNYLVKILILMVLTVLISVLALTLFVLPMIYAIVPINFIIFVFAFNPDHSIGDIIDVSFRLGTKKWLISFGLLLVSGILASLIGFLLCGIGALFTAPFIYHPLYFIYKKVIGFKPSTSVLPNEI